MDYAAWVNAAKTFMEDRLKDRIIEFVVTKFPFMASGPLGYILSKLASKLAVYLANTAELRAFYKYADFRSTAQGRDFSEAAIQYQIELEDGDGETIAKARQKLIDSARIFISF